MRAVNIGICRDNYFVVAEFFYIEYIANRGTKGNYEILNLFRCKHFVDSSALNVQNLSAQRKDGLNAPVAPHFRGTSGRISLHNKEFALFRKPCLAIGKFPRQSHSI